MWPLLLTLWNGLPGPDESNDECDDCCAERQNNAVGEQELALTSHACFVVGSEEKAGAVASANEPDCISRCQASKVGRFAHPGAPRHGGQRAPAYRLPSRKS